ncbi:MAG: DUF4132 domain-containing protein [Clostridiales bacterium]|jgi:thiol-disulfide isomerase/thioredoxin|nr:DUF4132 domain-containing protein [Clostridiales bacterium]
MFDSKNSQRNSTLVKEYFKRAKKLRLGASADIITSIWNSFAGVRGMSINTDLLSTYPNRLGDFNKAFKDLCGYDTSKCEILDDFFCPKMISALNSFFEKRETERIRRECELIMQCSYSYSLYRPSYRSRYAANYIDLFFYAFGNAINFVTLGLPLEEAMKIKQSDFSRYSNNANNTADFLPDFSNHIALALQDGNEAVFDLVQEAIYGDNSEITLNHDIIKGIVKSGNSRALELLGKLLLAAKAQEGLRQSILETCDSGTIESHIYFIRMILENDLCRFSSVIRAFDTWSGLGFGDMKQKAAEKCMSLALKYLTDKNEIEKGIASKDTTEIYLALWAISCRDVISATESSRKLIESPEKYKRLVGWYFVTHTNGVSFRHNIAVNYLHVRDAEELAWVCENLHVNGNANSYYYFKPENPLGLKKYYDSIYPKEKLERAALFDKLAEIAEFIGKKEKMFEQSVFPWYTQKLSVSQPIGVMISLAAYDFSAELILKLEKFISLMDTDGRLFYYTKLLNFRNLRHREILLEGLSDKSVKVRERIVEILNNAPLLLTEMESIAEKLSTQSSALRKSFIGLLKNQNKRLIDPAIQKLLDSQDKNRLIAGVELVEIFSKDNEGFAIKYYDKLAAIKASEKTPQDVFKLIEKITQTYQGEDEFNENNGYGLFNPASGVFSYPAYEAKRPAVVSLGGNELKSRIVPDENEVEALYLRIGEVFSKYRDYEYEAEYMNRTKEKVLLGNDGYGIGLLAGSKYVRGGYGNPITDYPLADIWLNAAGEFAHSKTKLAAVLSLTASHYRYGKAYKVWFSVLFSGFPICCADDKKVKELIKRLETKKINVNKCNLILNAIFNTGETCLFDFAFASYVNLVRKIPNERLKDECERDENPLGGRYAYRENRNEKAIYSPYLNYWRSLAYNSIKTDEQFTVYFLEMWYENLASGEMRYNGTTDSFSYLQEWSKFLTSGKLCFYGLSYKDIFRAFNLNLIAGDAICFYFSFSANAAEGMRLVTGGSVEEREVLAKYPAAEKLLEQVINRVVTFEENRGELPAILSNIAVQIKRFNGGITHFVNLLVSLGGADFYRGYDYSFYNSAAITKKESLSFLLRRCLPKEGETPQMLKDALTQAKISEKRVIQAAIYTPAWAYLLEKAMNIKGLKCGVWFFHAHINENFTSEKETETAIYSPITPQQFNDGTFDKNWFYEAYNTLGEKRFNELYKNAKYITTSNISHRRSQLYCDAVLGRLNLDDTRAEITQKRNQEKLRAYALIPLDENNKNDALQRYEFIRQFKKESRQFGSLRQASEGAAADTAMNNLAITTGYADTDRMTWALEGAKIESIKPLTQPFEIGEALVWLEIAEDGTASVNVRKKEKILKTIPKDLAKNEYVAQLKDAAKQLKDQKSRAKQSLEAAMISRAAFSPKEIEGLLNHPVLCAIVSVLVFAGEEKIGFPVISNGKFALKGILGEKQPVKENEVLVIAHPYDFISNKSWSAYQRHLYQNQIVQPFKQVFREYYPITQDELAAVNVSRRYAGNQIQPKKAAALLKTRGWTANYEEGLQRVWHKENITARMYALADWFSPADIEAPTLEEVQFFRRDKYEAVSFAEIAPVIFSETMRDIDLAVSAAHAGGVDPQASHSTVEMRIAIARELLAALSVKNVTFQSAHAMIKGKMGDYSVHMGSGVVHMGGTGMIAVVPVHSQFRGRIFLPFADDDPKTAEVFSKILLFADDAKIKDPGILNQIG